MRAVSSSGRAATAAEKLSKVNWLDLTRVAATVPVMRKPPDGGTSIRAVHVGSAGESEGRVKDPLDLVNGHVAGRVEDGVGGAGGLERAGGAEPSKGAGKRDVVEGQAASRVEEEAGRERGHERLGVAAA